MVKINASFTGKPAANTGKATTPRGCNPFLRIFAQRRNSTANGIPLATVLEQECQRRNRIDEIHAEGKEPGEKLMRRVFTANHSAQIFCNNVPITVQKMQIDVKSVPEWLANLAGEFLVEAYRKGISLTEVSIQVAKEGQSAEALLRQIADKNGGANIGQLFTFSATRERQYGDTKDPEKDLVSPSWALAEFIHYVAQAHWIQIKIGRRER